MPEKILELPATPEVATPAFTVAPSSNRYATGTLKSMAVMAFSALPVHLYLSYVWSGQVISKWSTSSVGERFLGSVLTSMYLGCTLYIFYFIHITSSVQIIATRVYRSICLWRSGNNAGAKKELRELANGGEKDMLLYVWIWAGVSLIILGTRKNNAT